MAQLQDREYSHCKMCVGLAEAVQQAVTDQP